MAEHVIRVLQEYCVACGSLRCSMPPGCRTGGIRKGVDGPAEVHIVLHMHEGLSSRGHTRGSKGVVGGGKGFC
jgi:hypothetical protein